ncbi:hypothetical protein KO506_01010 [Polaribacter vadi]|uniref:hypothetical protein n=1 Tax=Polaribacter TaxID=52959 RepID=UPI001C0A39F2|nr:MULTISPECIES: hypothetical protein [Polaribacter]MBU3009979.1 hypothetical protein [Polaribacter vadi]MDO6739785.1 hypothetical protein [Polaribacter sp. 1_MG-2023]
MKRIVLLLMLSIIYSCKEKFNPNEFKGTWIPINDKGKYLNLAALTFRNDSVYLEDYFTFNFKASYKIKRKSINFFLANDTLKYNLNFIRKDSILRLNHKNYMFFEGYSYEERFINYDLIHLKLNQPILSDSLFKNYDSAFHIFKDLKDSVQLKLNDKVSSDFNLIPGFAFGLHNQKDNIIIYIGKNITLKEIIKCYVELYKVNINNAFLVTNFDIKNNNYYGFVDNYEFWQQQIISLSDEKHEPILTEELSRKNYIKKYNPKIIKLNFKNDFTKLSEINHKDNYLIQINAKFSIDEYYVLKKSIIKLKKNHSKTIKTEFINLN